MTNRHVAASQRPATTVYSGKTVRITIKSAHRNQTRSSGSNGTPFHGITELYKNRNIKAMQYRIESKAAPHNSAKLHRAARHNRIAQNGMTTHDEYPNSGNTSHGPHLTVRQSDDATRQYLSGKTFYDPTTPHNTHRRDVMGRNITLQSGTTSRNPTMPAGQYTMETDTERQHRTVLIGMQPNGDMRRDTTGFYYAA